MKLVLLLVICLWTVLPTKAEESDTDDVEVVTLANPQECIQVLKEQEIAVFDFDIVYKVGEREENSRLKEQERMPHTIQLGKKQVLASLEENLIGMCVGEQRKITIPPSKAYGNQTIKLPGERILTGGVTIIADVKLLQIIPTSTEDLKFLFNLIDVDSNGDIDIDEVETVVELYGNMLDDNDGIRALVTDLFDSTDSNGDGKTTLNEFVNASRGANTKLKKEKLENYYKQVMKKIQERFNACPKCDGKCPEQKCPPGHRPVCDHCANKQRTIEPDQGKKQQNLKSEHGKKQSVNGKKSDDRKKKGKKNKTEDHDHDEL